MKFSEAWLRQLVDPDVTTTQLAEQLSMAGLEVESVEPVAEEFEGVVVGEVLAREQHPDADRLGVCRVNVGQEDELQIVCGASNVTVGMKVAVALVGAILPGDFKIKKAKLRGVHSVGMICSAAELGLEDSSEGIMPLPVDAAIGEDFRSFLSLDDKIIEVDLTPDRGDCLGMVGIAREVGVINRCPVTTPVLEPVAASSEQRFRVKLEAPEACPRYSCRVISGIDREAESPLWLQERLRRSGLRAISPVVDVTNYIMLELGQPMHGFDLAKLDSNIRVRMADQGEKLTLLDGQEVELQEGTLVIADDSRAVAMAGIMGGEGSAVTHETRDVLLESAFFAPTAISGRARSYGLHTDSSHRFERGVDPQLQLMALERATQLLLDIVGGEPGPVVESAAEEYIEQRPEILLRRQRVNRLLGLTIEDKTIVDILSRLEMELWQVDEGWLVKAPSCRFDIGIEVDLIEEIGRIYGYSEIPMHRSGAATVMRAEPEVAFSLHRAKHLLVDRDYQEVITYSFISQEMQQLTDPEHDTVELANPISSDMSIMRTSLWPGLLQSALYNQSRQQGRIRFFESGLRFIKEEYEIQQDLMLAGLITGTNISEQWGDSSERLADFFDIKGDLEAVLALTGCPEEFSFQAVEHPSLHPGQSAKVMRGGQHVGWVGMLHPELEAKFDLANSCYLFEIHVNSILDGVLPAFAPLSKFPSIRRDIAIVVEQDVEFSAVVAAIRATVPKILQDILLFDVYTGEKVDLRRKSLALGLILQETSHTLTDQDVEDIMASVLQMLQQEFNAELRE